MVLILGLARDQMRQVASDTDKPPGSSTAPAETTAVTPPTGLEAFADNSEKNASDIGKITVTPILGYLALVGTLVGIYVLYRLIPRFFLPPELVVEPFRNSSGDEALNGVLGGLSRLARQKLKPQLDILKLARDKRTQPEAKRETWANAGKLEYPRETPDQSLNELISPLKDLAPDQFKSLLGFIGAAFPRRGTRVMTDLQRRNTLLGELGISFELEDMSNRQERELYTIWEPTTEVTAVGEPQPPSSVPAGQPPPNRKGNRRVTKVGAKKTGTKKTGASADETEAKALYKLGALYEGDRDLAQAKSRYEDAFKKQPTSVENYAALKRVLEKDHTRLERYNELLDPAVRWLAIQVDRRGWLAKAKRGRLAKKFPFGPDWERYLGEVYNNFGVLYQASGPP
jgi:tetratricopeptide (TPR) repeat protein